MNVTSVLPVLQTVLAFCNIAVIAYGLFKFLNKPHDTLDERITTLEVEVKEIKSQLHTGNDKFRNLGEANEVLIHSTLALIEFEIQYCYTEHKEISKGLEKAKEDLNNYLAKR